MVMDDLETRAREDAFAANFEATVVRLQRDDYDGLCDFLDANPDYASERGESIANMVYAFGTMRHGGLGKEQLQVLATIRCLGGKIGDSGDEIRFSYTAKITREADAGTEPYGVTFPDLEGCVTQGGTLRRAQANARDALAGYLATRILKGDQLPEARYHPRSDAVTYTAHRVVLRLGELPFPAEPSRVDNTCR